MRNLILFIRRFFNLILFLLLEILCIILIGNTNTVQGNDIVSSANTIAGIVYKKHSDVLYYFGLRNMNDSLLYENARLRNQLEKYKYTDLLKDSIVHLQIGNNDTSKIHTTKYYDFIYRTARVINNSTNATDNYITINRGSKDGISKNMAVISSTGIVGRVEHVSAHYASIFSVLSSKHKVSAKLKNGTNGFVIWDEKDPDILTMIDVPQQINVKQGDSIYTNFSQYYPPDILIGVVQKVEMIKKNALQQIYLKSSTDFHNLQYVYVIENTMASEKKQLEELNNKK